MTISDPLVFNNVDQCFIESGYVRPVDLSTGLNRRLQAGYLPCDLLYSLSLNSSSRPRCIVARATFI